MSDSNAAEIFSRPNNAAIIYDLENFTLWTPTPNRPGFNSRLTFGERNGAPRMTLFPNIEGAPPAVAAGMRADVFYDFLNHFEEIVKGPNGKASKIDNMIPVPGLDRKKDPRPEDLTLKNITHYGKSQEGICWICIEQSDIPNLRFKLLPTVWHRFYDTEGNQLTQEAASRRYTLSLIECLRRAMERPISRLRPPSEKTLARMAVESGAEGKGYSAKSISTFNDGDVPL